MAFNPFTTGAFPPRDTASQVSVVTKGVHRLPDADALYRDIRRQRVKQYHSFRASSYGTVRQQQHIFIWLSGQGSVYKNVCVCVQRVKSKEQKRTKTCTFHLFVGVKKERFVQGTREATGNTPIISIQIDQCMHTCIL